MAGIRPYHYGDLRRQLVVAARAEVEEFGAERVVLTRLASKCGVSVAAPYRHFANREALLAEVAEEGFAELKQALHVASRVGALPRERLVNAGVAYVRFAVANPHVFMLMFQEGVREAVGSEAEASLDVLVDLVCACRLDVPVETAVRASWAMVHGQASLAVGVMTSFGEATDDRVRGDIDALLDGMLSATCAPGAPPQP